MVGGRGKVAQRLPLVTAAHSGVNRDQRRDQPSNVPETGAAVPTRYEGMGGRGVLRQRESQRVSTVVENDMHPSTPWFGGIGRRAVKTQVEDAQYGRTVRVGPSLTQQSVSLTRYTRFGQNAPHPTHRTLCRTHSTQSLSARFGHGALCLASRISAVEMAWSQAALVRCSAHDPVQYCCTFRLTAILRRSGESSWQPGNSVPRAHVKLKSGLPGDKCLLQSIRRSVEYRYPD